MSAQSHWLMKAEPDSRVVKGKDVKFSVDDFEAAGTTSWEGVRSHEAKNLMKAMKIGDRVLFYHSNCKNPGVVGFAEVSREAYPDHTAWDPDHPYYDAKTDKADPKWFMVDLHFTARAAHPVPLSLFRCIAAGPVPPDEVAYIGAEGVNAIKGMPLVTRGRLSVQRVDETCWNVVQVLAEKGGWEAPSAAPKPQDEPGRTRRRAKAGGKKRSRREDGGDGGDNDGGNTEAGHTLPVVDGDTTAAAAGAGGVVAPEAKKRKASSRSRRG